MKRYCTAKLHPLRQRVVMKGIDVQRIAGKPVFLCRVHEAAAACWQSGRIARGIQSRRQTLPDALVMRRVIGSIWEVMNFRHLAMRGACTDYLWHLFF